MVAALLIICYQIQEQIFVCRQKKDINNYKKQGFNVILGTAINDEIANLVISRCLPEAENRPKPMMPMDGLRRALLEEGPCPKLWVKREDMTSHTGWVVTKYEDWNLPLQKAKNAPNVITSGSMHSNTILQVSAVC